MTDRLDNASESSLPTQHVQTLRSSPPFVQPSCSSPQAMESSRSPSVAQAKRSLHKMDDESRVSPEPPFTQNDMSHKPPTLNNRLNSEDTERPPSAQQRRLDSDEHAEEDDDVGTEDEELDPDPAEKIVDFDWEALMQKYHDAMAGCHDEESKLAQEFESLMNCFHIWANSGHDHETERTFQRLTTRTTYVQNSEDRLEKTRTYYISVVKAFESALDLLKVHGFGG